jgi:hypothetical protein
VFILPSANTTRTFSDFFQGALSRKVGDYYYHFPEDNHDTR